ncbi:MAG: hypothetical protein FJ267_08550, partial [Planctomycetes bacterium]|nr:hypothetical protein [Planctomycetota bacterium]
MQWTYFLSMVLSLLTGCTLIPRHEVASEIYLPQHDTTPVSTQEMTWLVPGNWYQVRLPERDGRSGVKRGIYRSGYVGRLTTCDENSLTLTDVTKCTLFDSTSILRRLPLVGSPFENGWESHKNESAPVTVRREQAMWIEPISSEDGDKFRRFDEIMNEDFSLEHADVNNNDVTNDVAVLSPNSLPDMRFLLPDPKREEVLVQRRIEIRDIQPGQWYFITMKKE